MSLIFQSLQKLDEQQESPPPGIGDPVVGKPSSRSPLVRWLLPVAIGLVLSLAIGSGAVYAVQYLKDRLPEKEQSSDRHGRRDRERSENTTSPIEAPAETAEERTPVSAPADNVNETVSEPEATHRYQFHPPVDVASQEELPAMAAVESKEPQPLQTSAAPAADALPEPLMDAGPVPSETNDEIAPMAPPVVDVEREAAERARRAALAKSARIGRLVRQIEQAFAGSTEAGDPRVLLEKLARLKGENHPYVAKLRAYYNFQRGKMALAEADLHKVIAAYPEDLEAGINLALIEIQDQRYKKALARLKALRKGYPENEQIADLIKRLR